MFITFKRELQHVGLDQDNGWHGYDGDSGSDGEWVSLFNDSKIEGNGWWVNVFCGPTTITYPCACKKLALFAWSLRSILYHVVPWSRMTMHTTTTKIPTTPFPQRIHSSPDFLSSPCFPYSDLNHITKNRCLSIKGKGRHENGIYARREKMTQGTGNTHTHTSKPMMIAIMHLDTLSWWPPKFCFNNNTSSLDLGHTHIHLFQCT